MPSPGPSTHVHIHSASPANRDRDTAGEANSFLTLWHLLSLDAPTVATLWTCFIARSNHVHLPLASAIAMFLAVWTLYAADRLLDTQSPVSCDLELRHHFHHQYRSAFLIGILLAAIALALLLPHLTAEALHLYLILGVLVFGYFVIIHASGSAHRLPKEFAVGICFASAIFIPTVAREPSLRLTLLPSALLYAALCTLNCLFIYAWEHDPADPDAQYPAHAITLFALRGLRIITITTALFATTLATFDHHSPWPISAAIALSCAVLLLLHHKRAQIRPTTLRATADLALLTPLLFLSFT